MTQKSNRKNNLWLSCLKGLGVICLVALLFAYGWIAGLIWLIFFRKRMNENKQKKYTIMVSIASAFSFIFFLYSLSSAPSTSDTVNKETIVETTEAESEIPSETSAESNEPINAVEEFISLYNASAEEPIANLTEINIHDKSGGYYRTEFRTAAYNDATAMTGTIGDNISIDLIQYSTGFRVYILADSYDSIQTVLESTVKTYDSSITDDLINSSVYNKIDSVGSGVSFYINNISGYYEVLNKETGGCSVMLDVSPIEFIE